MAATLKKMTSAIGYTECCRCHERIAVGSYCYREGSKWWHSEACAPVAAHVVAAPVPAVRPASTRAFGALVVDDSFRAWESEYEREGR